MRNDNHKTVKSRVLNVINNLFEQNGQKDIPNLKDVCLLSNTNRKTALKYMYEWWDKHQNKKKSDVLCYLPNLKHQSEGDVLSNAIAHIQCLLKELSIYSEQLNYLPDTTYPLGNYLLDSLQEIEDKLFAASVQTEEMHHHKEQLELDLKNSQSECKRLYDEIEEMHNISSKKLVQLREELDASRREAMAANHLVKSLKREKRMSKPKKMFYFYKYNS